MVRQLDFFRKLTRAFRPKSEPKPAPTPAPKGSDADLENHARTLLAELGCDGLASAVRVVWNSRMRSTAGMAYPRRGLITLNPHLREFGEEEVDRTLRHELAHLLAHHRAGRRRIAPHGPEWVCACRDLGLADEKRCHDLPLPRRKMTARHFYRCPSCEVVLHRVRPLRRKSACLVCCRRHNRGGYDERFRFQKIAPPA
ncbi:MAG: SprT-like domain-containing protein [Chthoniobacteraceae bacterium]